MEVSKETLRCIQRFPGWEWRSRKHTQAVAESFTLVRGAAAAMSLHGASAGPFPQPRLSLSGLEASGDAAHTWL